MSQVLTIPWLHLVLSFPLGLLYGPGLVILLYGLPQYPAKGKTFILHLVPFVAALIVYLILILDSSLHYRYSFDYTMSIQFLTLLHLGGYLLYLRPSMSTILARQCKENKTQKVIWYLSFLILFICLSSLLVNMIEETGNIYLHRIFSLLTHSLFLLGASFIFSTHKKLKFCSADFVGKEQRGEDVFEKNRKKSPIVSLSLTREQEASYRSRVELFIQTLAYLDSDLNKEKFSSQLEIPVQHIAPFLKQEFGKGFNAFVNQLRLNYAIRQLKNQELLYTIDDLSMICGFSSRASFYRNFQAEFGCSPHQYRLDYAAPIG